MKTVHINASKEYDILIGSGLLSEVGSKCLELFGKCRAAVVTDDNVAPLYLKKVTKSLEDSGIKAFSVVFHAGEESKNKDTLFEILESFAENELSSGDIAIALGGGVAGDLTGLAAALYKRGIACVQLPTTLLAAVDSSVGGKTAVDLSHGKNLAGVFHQPSLVICDTDVFSTLPPRIFSCGTAEVIKYGILFDRDFFNTAANGLSDIEATVEKCVDFKKKCVENDEFDTGERRLLNLGHTFGHAVEMLSGYEILHGEAVAVGTVMAAELALKLGICDSLCVDEIKAAFKSNGLPIENTFGSEEIKSVMINDKKRSGNEISFILPEKIGKCIIKNINISEL